MRGHHPLLPSLLHSICTKPSHNGSVSAFWPKPLICEQATLLLLLPTHFHSPHLPTTSPHHCELLFDMACSKPSPCSSVFVFCAQNPTPTYVKEWVPQPTPPASKTHTSSLQHCPPYPDMTSATHCSPKSSPTAQFWMLNTPPTVCAQSATTTLSTLHPIPSMRSPTPKYESCHPIVCKN